MIVLPLLILTLVNFVFSTTNPSFTQIQREIACPMPSMTGLWNDTRVVPSGILNYTAKTGNPTYNYADKDSPDNVITFTCTKVHTVDGFDYLCGAPFGSFCGQLIFVGDTLGEVGHKITAFFALIATFFTYPASITGMAWWAFAQFFLFALMLIGILMIVRGSGLT